MKRALIMVCIIIVALVYSCKKHDVIEDWASTITFKYVNNTEYNISLFLFVGDSIIVNYKIAPNDTLLRTDIGWAGPPIFRFYDGNKSVLADSIYLAFSDQRYLTFNRTDSIFDYDYYESIQTDDYAYNEYYYFETSDFERALPITE